MVRLWNVSPGPLIAGRQRVGDDAVVLNAGKALLKIGAVDLPGERAWSVLVLDSTSVR
jgi:hypothetical protein